MPRITKKVEAMLFPCTKKVDKVMQANKAAAINMMCALEKTKQNILKKSPTQKLKMIIR